MSSVFKIFSSKAVLPALAGAAAIAVIFLAVEWKVGLGGGGAGSPYVVTLAMRPQDRNVKHVLDKLEREFNSAHGDVKLRVMWGDTLAKLPLLVAAGKMPDLWETANFNAAGKEDLLVDLSPYLKRDWNEMGGDDFYPSLLDGCRNGGRLNLVPRWYNLPILTYRPSAFREAGVSPPDETWTWDDFCEAGRRLAKRGADGKIVRWGCDINSVWWEEWFTCVRQGGGEFFDVSGKRVTLDTPEAVAGLDHWVRKFREGWAPGLLEVSDASFLGGRAAMSVCTNVMAWKSLRETEGLDWDIAPLPAGPAGRVTGEMAIAGIGISRDCRNREAAWTVLKFLLSREAIAEYVRAGATPVRKSAAEEVFLAGKPGERIDPQHREALICMLSVARSTPSHPRFIELCQRFIIQKFERLLRDRNADTAQVAREATEECNSILALSGKQDGVSRAWLIPQAALILLLGAGALYWFFMKKNSSAAGASRARAGDNLRLLLFLSPWLAGFLLFVAGPMLYSFYLSQTDCVVGQPETYIGMANYKNLLGKEPDFWASLGRTAVFTAISVPLSVAAALAAALMLNLRFIRGIGVFRTIFFLPSLLPVAASTLVWAFFLDPCNGIVNMLLAKVGIHGPGWFHDPAWALPSLAVMAAWGFGGAMLIFLAGLQDVPGSLHEAAMLDGAGAWSRFRHVTLPFLSPVIFFNLLMGAISAMQVFAQAYIVFNTGASSGKSLHFYVLILFQHAFERLRMGLGSAMAWILFVILVLFTVIYFKLSKRWVYYAD